MIRLATHDDVDFIYSCGEKFYATLDYGVRIGRDKGIAFIRMIIDHAQGLALIFECDGKLVGCLLAVCQDHPFAPCTMASELMWWVDPEFRGRRESLKLFDTYEYWAARRMNADIISCVAAPENEKLHQYYKRKGYKPKELTFMKEFI